MIRAMQSGKIVTEEDKRQAEEAQMQVLIVFWGGLVCRGWRIGLGVVCCGHQHHCS